MFYYQDIATHALFRDILMNGNVKVLKNDSDIIAEFHNIVLKKLYLGTYSHRLRSHEIKPDLIDIYFLKTELWFSRFKNIKMIKTPHWESDSLDKVLSLQFKKTIKRWTQKE